jgi:hypothetical protein
MNTQQMTKKEKLRIANLHCRLVVIGVRVIDAGSCTITTERDQWSKSEGRFVPVIEIIPSTKESVDEFVARNR